MPAGDGTGPTGMGPMTGRAAGFCAGYGVPGYANPVGGRGLGFGGWARGRGGGGGRGWRHRYYATGMTGWQRGAMAPPAYPAPYAAPPVAPTGEEQIDALSAQAEYFEKALGDIRKRIDQLQADKNAE